MKISEYWADVIVRTIVIIVVAIAASYGFEQLKPRRDRHVICTDNNNCTIYEGPVHLTRNPDGTWSVKGVKTP